MNAVAPAYRLHLNKRETTFAVPLYITATCCLISILIALLFLRAGSEPGSAGWVQGSRSNPGLAYALVGFIVYLGVQSVATTFPFALTLGTTRRGFVVGTLLWAATLSAYLTAVFTVLTLVEKATGHWFAGFYLFDVFILGAGDITRLVPIVFLATLTALTVGGVFGAAWVRLGSRGPLAIAIALIVVLLIIAIAIVPFAPQIVAAFQLWWLAIAAGIAIAGSAVGMWGFLRSAIVR